MVYDPKMSEHTIHDGGSSRRRNNRLSIRFDSLVLLLPCIRSWSSHFLHASSLAKENIRCALCGKATPRLQSQGIHVASFALWGITPKEIRVRWSSSLLVLSPTTSLFHCRKNLFPANSCDLCQRLDKKDHDCLARGGDELAAAEARQHRRTKSCPPSHYPTCSPSRSPLWAPTSEREREGRRRTVSAGYTTK